MLTGLGLTIRRNAIPTYPSRVTNEEVAAQLKTAQKVVE